MKYNQETGKIQKLTEEINQLSEQVNSLSEGSKLVLNKSNFINNNLKYESDWIVMPKETSIVMNVDRLGLVTFSNFGAIGYYYYCGGIVLYLQLPEELSTCVKLNIFFKSNDEGMSIIKNSGIPTSFPHPVYAFPIPVNYQQHIYLYKIYDTAPLPLNNTFRYPIWVKFIIKIEISHKYDNTVETIKII